MLKKKATKAVGWSAAEQFIQQGLHFAVSIVLARLIAPEAFGTVALMYLFTGLAGVFRDGGLSAALIQKKNTTATDESTVFWFNIAIATLFTAVLFASAPYIAAFYSLPILIPITKIYSLEFLVGSLNSVQATLFRKRLDFKTPLKIGLYSGLISAAAGIILAFMGYGIWALVTQAMTNTAIRTIGIWSYSPWRPAFAFSASSFRTLFSFGGYMFLSQILNVGYQRFYTLLIGKWFGAYELGIYNRADNTRKIPSEALGTVLNKVAFPIFSQANDNTQLLIKGLRFALRNIMLVNAPLMIGLSLVAEPLVLTLFGPVWKDSAEILSILALSGVLFPLHLLNLSVLQATGHSSKFFRVEVIKKITGLTFLIIGMNWGIIGMAWGTVASSCFAFFYNAYYNGKFLKHGATAQLRDIAPILLCVIPMASTVYYCSIALALPPPLQLLTLALVGVTIYLSATFIFKISALQDAISFFKETILKRKAVKP